MCIVNLWTHGIYTTIQEDKQSYQRSQTEMDKKQKSANDATRVGEELALHRAEQQARKTAARTGTPLVSYRDGKIDKQIVTGDVLATDEQRGRAAGAE